MPCSFTQAKPLPMTTQGVSPAPSGRKTQAAQRCPSTLKAPSSRSIAGVSLQSPLVADLDEVKQMIEAALPGAEVEVIDETGQGDHLRAVVSAGQFDGLR